MSDDTSTVHGEHQLRLKHYDDGTWSVEDINGVNHDYPPRRGDPR